MSTVLNETQAAEILARQVNEEIDNTGVAADGKVIFEGQIVTRAEAARIHDERITAGRKSAFFDVQNVIEDNMPLGQPRLRLRTNLLYGMAYRVRAALTEIVYAMHEAAREVGHINNFNEFVADLNECKNSAQYAEDMGYAHHGAGIHKVRALLSIYNEWRDLCIKDAAQLRTKNKLPELTAVLAEEDRPDTEAAAKLNELIKFSTEEMDAESAAEVAASMRAKADAEFKDRMAQRKNIVPLLEIILVEAMEHVEVVHFYELPIETQGVIIDSLLRSLDKLPSQLINMRSVSVVEMATTMPSVRRMKQVLNDVLSDPRFDA